jgi:tetratricopeptide (TPR) repeat protein
LSEGTQEKSKLEELKARIRKSGFPVVENYPTPERLAERVREDLWSLIDEAFPESEVPDALTMERRRHEAYTLSRIRLYLGGERYFTALDKAMDACKPVLITGQSGGGKSALIANWFLDWSSKHPKAAVIVHHLGCGADAADPVRMAVRIMQEIAIVTGDEFKPESDPDKQLEQLPLWLAIASAWAQRENKEVLIVLDGLDKLSDREHLRWFPAFLPPQVKLVASCLDGEILEATKTRLSWVELKVKAFTKAEQSRFITEYLGRYRKKLTSPQAKTLQSHPLSGNPLFLMTVLEELRVFGVHEELEQRLATLLFLPSSKAEGDEPTVDDVFEHVLARVEADLGEKPVQQAMEAIWASRAGLYQDELLAIAKLVPAQWAATQNALDESIYESGGKISFGHDYLRKAAEDRYGLTGKKKLKLHRKLAEWFSTQEVDARVAEELPWQWRQAEEKGRLKECLLRREIFERCYCNDERELLSNWLWIKKVICKEYEKAWEKWGIEFENENNALDLSASRLSDFLRTSGFYGGFTELLMCRSLDVRNQSLGSEHPKTLSSMNNLGVLLSDKGDYDGAEALYRRVFAGYKKVLGADHPDTLASMNNLGVLLSDKGDYDGAEVLYRRVFAGYEKVLGADHPDTLASMNNLGVLLSNKGDYDGAEVLYRRVFAGYEKVLGADHPDTLASVNNLGVLLSDKGDYDSSLALHRMALKIKEKVLGTWHPSTLATMNNLGNLLRAKGDLAGAEMLHRPALERREKALGTGHPDTLDSMNNLGNLLRAKGDLAGAEMLHRQALERREKALGTGHPDTLDSMNNLGNLLSEKGEYVSAEGLYRRALKGYEKLLGAAHSDTLNCILNLGNLLTEKGEYESAEALYRRAMRGYEKVLGAAHPKTLSSMNNLGLLLHNKGDYDESEKIHRKTLEGREMTLGIEHHDTFNSVKNLALVLRAKSDYQGAIIVLRRSSQQSKKCTEKLRYLLACCECLSGNIDAAKYLIKSHLKLHPEEKKEAFEDDDFAVIRDFIETQ